MRRRAAWLPQGGEGTLDAVVEQEEDLTTVRLRGPIDRGSERSLERLGRQVPGRNVLIDLAEVSRLGGIGVALLQSLVGVLEKRGLNVSIRPRDEDQARLIGVLDHTPEAPLPSAVPSGGAWRQLGDAVLGYHHVLATSLWAAVAQLFRGPRRRLEQSVRDVVAIGAGAFPLVALIAFLVGFILALQAAPPLQRFGQEIFVANLVGLSLTRELGPLLTAVLVTGRTGAALTAEIGTMKVSEELDALRVMGISPVEYLVAPRLRTMIVVLPILAVAADVVGTIGGMVVGKLALEIPYRAYITQTREFITVRDVGSGLIKAALFAIVIVSVAAYQGFSTTQGAVGVGRSTTRAVVQSIIGIIVVDAVATMVMYERPL